jgi:hypothetical protein
MHGHEGDLASHPDIRPTTVIEAKDVAFDLGGGARRDVEVILNLNLSRRHLVADERECGGVHDGAAFDSDHFSG